jgi:hypothetical protein
MWRRCEGMIPTSSAYFGLQLNGNKPEMGRGLYNIDTKWSK